MVRRCQDQERNGHPGGHDLVRLTQRAVGGGRESEDPAFATSHCDLSGQAEWPAHLPAAWSGARVEVQGQDPAREQSRAGAGSAWNTSAVKRLEFRSFLGTGGGGA